MKLKIMIMALLLITGIGSAVNRLPATEFVGDVEMRGSNLLNATLGGSGPYAYVGSQLWCDYITDGVDDAEQVVQAYLDGYSTVVITSTIVVNGSNPIWFPNGQKRLTAPTYYPVSVILDPATSGPMLLINSTGNEIDRVTFDGNRSEYIADEHGILWTSGNQNNIRLCRMVNIGADAIHIDAPNTSLGGGEVSRNYIYNVYRYGLYLSGNDLMFFDNEVGWGSDISIYMSSANNNHISRNHIWCNYSSGAVDTATMRLDGYQNVVSMNDFDGITKWGIVITAGSDYSQIIGNKFWNVIYDGGYAVIIDATQDTTTHLMINNNMARKVSGYLYAINIDPSHNHTVVGNNFAGLVAWGTSGNTIAGNDMIIGS